MPNRSLTIAQVLCLPAEQPHVVLWCLYFHCFLVPAYFAWKLPPKDFVEWYKSQALFSNPRSGQPLFSYLSDDYLRWVNRFAVPITGLAAICVILWFVL
jgi:hypothetical protein